MSPRELERRAKHKLAVLRHVEEVRGNVSATCRCYGISRQCNCRWRRRFDDEGVDGLEDRPSVPHHQPTKTDPEVIEKILRPRQQYHFGPQKISMYLHRYHDLAISPSGVWRILHKLDLSRLPAAGFFGVTNAPRSDGSATRSHVPATSYRLM
ncbi:helix-turn-helix domain-containing protein [Rhodococcus rhodochrous]|uniref:helix-turn-helix domain-containing protein n=1 Tax=Rhodococcus rhodochrous TaxID=1829 RepID=UPI0006C849A0|nr:helix-turn-helix domain-containing protein [Rhodococcus rhodochrous]